MNGGRRGHTLVEMFISLALLSGLGVVLFFMFSSGTRSFRMLVTRQGLQAEARRISSVLRRDLVLTHYRTAEVEDRTATNGSERDGLMFVGLDNWSNTVDPARFDENLRPIWNRRVMWYATRDDTEKLNPPGDSELGQLVRKVVNPAPILFPLPYGNFLSFMVSPMDRSVDYKIYSRNVVSFAVRLDPATETVMAHLVLRQGAGVGPGGAKQTVESFEVFIDTHPENTWPAL